MQRSDWKQDAKNKRRRIFGDSLGAFKELEEELGISAPVVSLNVEKTGNWR